MLVIPAIDIRGGQCVRLIQGDYANERIYDQDPVSVARQFLDAGAQFLHVVDLDGAKAGEPQNWEVLAGIAAVVPIEVGGGVRSLETARRLLDVGVQRVVVGSKLVQDVDLSAEFFQQLGDKVVAGIDARSGLVSTEGWTEGSSVTAKDLAKRVESQGAKRIILTDIARDGMLTGPNLHLLHEIQTAVNIPIIQSGGIGTLDDLKACALAGPEGVIVGRAIYEGTVDIREALGLFNF